MADRQQRGFTRHRFPPWTRRVELQVRQSRRIGVQPLDRLGDRVILTRTGRSTHSARDIGEGIDNGRIRFDGTLAEPVDQVGGRSTQLPDALRTGLNGTRVPDQERRPEAGERPPIRGVAAPNRDRRIHCLIVDDPIDRSVHANLPSPSVHRLRPLVT